MIPGLPAAVFQMYSKAKQKTYDNLASTTVLRTSLPWTVEEYEETREIMGDDYWRYGIEANRKELQCVMRYTYEQGLVKKLGKFEDMFHPDVMRLKG